MTEATIEEVAKALELATNEVDDHIGIFDYTSYGKKPGEGAHVVVDNRTNTILAEGKDSDDAHRLYNEYRDRYLARAAITAHLAALSRDGLTVVPIKPTDEMLRAYYTCMEGSHPTARMNPDKYLVHNLKAGKRWHAMIEAATPPSKEKNAT